MTWSIKTATAEPPRFGALCRRHLSLHNDWHGNNLVQELHLWSVSTVRTCSLLHNKRLHRFVDRLRQHYRLDSPGDGVLTLCHCWNVQLCRRTALAAPNSLEGQPLSVAQLECLPLCRCGEIESDSEAAQLFSVRLGPSNLSRCGVRGVVLNQRSHFMWTSKARHASAPPVKSVQHVKTTKTVRAECALVAECPRAPTPASQFGQPCTRPTGAS